MHYPAHANIFRGAVAAQPTETRTVLEPYSALFDDAGNYPDIFDNGTLPASEKDPIDPDWRRFCLYPSEFAGKTMHSWPFPKEQQIKHLPMLRHLFQNAVDAYAAGDIEGAIKFVGCLSHYLGDITQPAHLLDQRLMEQLLPPPTRKEAFHYHWTLEQVVGECPELGPPAILGATVEEACWTLMEFNRRAIDGCRAYIVPTVQALFRDDEVEAVRLASYPVKVAGEGTRDILATVVAIADGTATSPVVNVIDLRTWFPDEESHPIAYGRAFIDANKSTGPLDGPLLPSRLLVGDGVVQDVQGLGVIGRSTITWYVPAGMFGRFEATIGMHAELAADGSGEFVVELDDAEVFRSESMTAGTVAREVTIALGTSEKITLKVADPSGGITFYHNHAVWAEPRLTR